mmetsp:Transcript_32106/g.56358  ORF Transcript_32106/g.56358 Transcript_32106/m.56358 type:complete len:87 (+) Transcript_32106:2005-2265(+)
MVDCLPNDDFQKYRSKHSEDRVEDSESQYLFVCQNPRVVALPQNIKGGHKLWNAPLSTVSALCSGLQPSKQDWLLEARGILETKRS